MDKPSINYGLSDEMTEKLNKLAEAADQAQPKEYHLAKQLYFRCKINPGEWPKADGETPEERGEGMTQEEIKAVQFYLNHFAG